MASGQPARAVAGALEPIQALDLTASRTTILVPNDITALSFNATNGGILTLGTGGGALNVCRTAGDCPGGVSEPLFTMAQSDVDVPAACIANGLNAGCDGSNTRDAFAFGLASTGSPPVCTSPGSTTIDTTICAPEPTDGLALDSGEAIVVIYLVSCGVGFAAGAGGFGVDTDSINVLSCPTGVIYAASGNQSAPGPPCPTDTPTIPPTDTPTPTPPIAIGPTSTPTPDPQVNGLSGVSGVAITDDGAYVYAAGTGDDAVVAFKRNPSTGVLNFIGTAGGVGGAVAIATSPDGAHVYAAGATSNAVGAFTRDPQTGALSLGAVRTDGVGGVDGLAGASAIAISPDGEHLYVAGATDNAVAVFARDPGSGALTFVQAYSDGGGGIDGLAGASGVAVSPDGAHVYATGAADNAVAVFSRNIGTGQLTFVQSKTDGAGGVDGLAGASSVALSPDGEHVYVTGAADDAVAVFARDAGTGQLTFVEAQVDGAGGVDGLGGAAGVVVGPDGNEVYASGGGDNAVAVFTRDPTSGSLTFVDAELDGTDGVTGLGGAAGLVVSPDGGHLYVAASSAGAVAVFQTLATLAVFDSDSTSLRVAAQAPAGAAAVADQRVGLLRPEGNGGGSDLNGDGDSDDQVAYLYDGQTDNLIPLGVAANRVALSSGLVALTVPEAREDNADRNGDGDTSDDVLAVFSIGGTPPPLNLGVAADAIAVSGTAVVFTTPERAEGDTGSQCGKTDPKGGCDLNGDADAKDRVLRVYRQNGAELIELGQAAEDFVVEGDLVAFRTSEAAMNGADLNDDGDAADSVMQVYDLATDTLVGTGQAAIPCTIPGCDPFIPYKIKGDTVSFLTRESDQGGRDLNGDGDATDIVVQVFHLRTQQLQVFDSAGGTPGSAGLPPFPEVLVDGTIAYVQASELERGEDLNGDGDATDPVVVLLAGDFDEDGSFDDRDSCRLTSNPEQSDSDLDALGDSCDPTPFCGDFTPSAPPPAPSGAAACQEVLGRAGAKYLKQRATAERKCLDAIAKGKLNGNATALCRGGIVDGVQIPPQDGVTARKLAKARAKFEKTIGSLCPSATLAQLDACADTTADTEACVIAAYGAATLSAVHLAYGPVAAIADGAELTCQLAVGTATVKYLAAVVKAMHRCLDAINSGDLSGDPQALCLGSMSAAGVAPPLHSTTRKKIEKAEAKLRAKVADRCAMDELAALTACGTDPLSAGDCLACSQWRHAVEAVRSAYGPR